MIGQFGSRSDAIFIGGQLLNIQHGIITASASGNTQVVAAQSGKKILVIAYTLLSNGTVNVKFQSATTDISGLKYLIANTGLVCGDLEKGWFETAAGEALNINLSGNVAVGGELVYVVY
jgi:hypothetical protein